MTNVVPLKNLKKPFEAYRGDGPYVFVSYSHKDTEAVFIELVRLKKLGFNVWFDEGLSPGSRWSDELAERIANSALFLYYVTPRSAASTNCQDEAIFVLEAGNPFLAVHLDETELPPGLQLRMGPRQAILRFDLEPEVYQNKLYEAIVAQAPALARDTIDLRHGFRLGDFNVEPLTGAITNADGDAWHVEPKVMDVFVCLAKNINELVTREQLLDAVWKGQVAADELLTRAISELRRVLQHDGDAKYIETVPKRGYRLLGDVQVPKDIKLRKSEPLPPVVSPRTGHIWAYALIGMIVLAISYVAVDRIVIEPREDLVSESSESDVKQSGLPLPIRTAIRPIALTSMEGFEHEPAFSPDGAYVAYVAQEIRGDFNSEIVVQETGGGASVQLTDTDAREMSPTWSSDGTQIAFFRVNADQESQAWDHDIIVKPLLGGFETKLASVGKKAVGLDWSPDGKYLAYAASGKPDELQRVYLLSVATGESRQITAPEAVNDEFMPRFSPNGRSLAYLLGRDAGSHLCIQYLGNSESECITPEEEEWHLWDFDWTPDSQALVAVVGGPSGGRMLMRVPATAGNPVPLPYGDEAKFVSIAQFGNRLVYSREFQDHNLWRAPGPVAVDSTEPPSVIVPSTWDELYPAYAPDGNKIAFMSARSSFWEIWVANADGSNPRQLTRMGNATWPRWSPDSRQIVFSSRGYPEGTDDLVKVHFKPNRLEVYVIDASGGFPRLVSDIGEEANNPSFSADGRWIYFEGRFDPSCVGGALWKRQIDTGEQKKVVDCVIRPLAGPDGRLYFFLGASGGIQSMPEEGGDYRMELNEDERGCVFPVWGWTFWGRNLVFIDCVDQKVRMLDLETRETREIAEVFKSEIHARGAALDVSPDGKWIIYSQLERAGSDLMLVEPFQ